MLSASVGSAHLFVPPRNWQLRSEDGGSHFLAIFADLPRRKIPCKPLMAAAVKQVLSVVAGEPDPPLFAAPAGRIERRPSELMRMSTEMLGKLSRHQPDVGVPCGSGEPPYN